MTSLSLLARLGLLLVCCLFSIPAVNSKWVEGTILPDGPNDRLDWIFLTRFCFMSKDGRMVYDMEYPMDYGDENLLFYYDDPGQWDSVYKRGLNCTQKVGALNNNNIFGLVDGNGMCKSETRSGRGWLKCTGSMDFTSARERWWFVTLSRCSAPHNPMASGLYLKYKLHMTNGDGLLHKEFSADEFYILLVDIIFFILYIKLMVLSIVFAVKLINKQLLHSTYKLFMVAVTLWTVHLLCMVIAWGSYGNTGWELPKLEVLGRIIAAASNVVFILMLILLAKGYTIVRGKLTNKSMVKITTFIFLYVISTIVLFIWEGAFFDEGLVLYYFESPPGYCLVAVWLLGWLWFTKAAVFTLKHFKAKTNFYIAFYTIYSVWFWATPIVILIAMFSMAKWTREKTVNGVQQFVAYLGHLIFLILTMPNKVNTNFPFHIKTTQIGFMQDEDDLTGGDDSARSGENGSTRGSAGAYALSSGNFDSGTGPNLSFFITSKQDSSAGGDDPSQGRMYTPLDVNSMNIFNNGDNNDYPPPAYAQATQPEENGQQSAFPSAPPVDSNTQLAHNSDHQPNYHDNAGYSNTLEDGSEESSKPNLARLPPLRLALQGDDPSNTRATTLPPIRGTGLPSLPLGQMEGEGVDNPAPPNYDAMFGVGKKY